MFYDTILPSSPIAVEESEGFLRPVDSYRDLASNRDLENVRTLEAARTRLFPPSDAPFVTYNRVSWRLDVRKEVSGGEGWGC